MDFSSIFTIEDVCDLKERVRHVSEDMLPIKQVNEHLNEIFERSEKTFDDRMSFCSAKRMISDYAKTQGNPLLGKKTHKS